MSFGKDQASWLIQYSFLGRFLEPEYYSYVHPNVIDVLGN